MEHSQLLALFCAFCLANFGVPVKTAFINGLVNSLPDPDKKANNPTIEDQDLQILFQQAAEMKKKVNYEKFLPYIQMQRKTTLKPTTKSLYSPVIRNGNICCYNGGTCLLHEAYANRRCNCPPGFTGYQCDVDINECLIPEICKNNKICINSYGSFICACPNFFIREGDDCIPQETCDEFPCLNGAECIDIDDEHFKCFCKLGFVGTKCQKKIPECEESSCASDERCKSTKQGFRCINEE